MNRVAAISTTAACAAISATGLRLHYFSSSSCFKTLIPFNHRRRPKSSIIASTTKNSMQNNFSPSISSIASNSPIPLTPESKADEPKLKPKPNPQPWLIVGLGNPGKRYNGTRHNVGFEMLDTIAEAEGIPMSSISFKALFGRGFIGEVFDDMDLPFGKLRLLPKGGHGGHNGMKSIINHLKGSRDFPRLRIGIGRPPGKMDAVNFVMRPFNKEEREELNFTFHTGLEAVRILLRDGINKSATFVNSAKSLECF